MFEGMAVRGNTHLGILLEFYLRLAFDVLHVELVLMDTNLCLVNKARKKSSLSTSRNVNV